MLKLSNFSRLGTAFLNQFSAEPFFFQTDFPFLPHFIIRAYKPHMQVHSLLIQPLINHFQSRKFTSPKAHLRVKEAEVFPSLGLAYRFGSGWSCSWNWWNAAWLRLKMTTARRGKGVGSVVLTRWSPGFFPQLADRTGNFLQLAVSPLFFPLRYSRGKSLSLVCSWSGTEWSCGVELRFWGRLSVWEEKGNVSGSKWKWYAAEMEVLILLWLAEWWGDCDVVREICFVAAW